PRCRCLGTRGASRRSSRSSKLSVILLRTPLKYASIFFQLDGLHRDLHPFPTRRSSDLHCRAGCGHQSASRQFPALLRAGPEKSRSEEHTSELQSRVELVCRLLLEKKKKDAQALLRVYHQIDGSHLGDKVVPAAATHGVE